MEKSEIKAYIYCVECVKDMPDGVPMSEYGRLSIGATDLGLLVWCDRHDCEVVFLDVRSEKVN